MAYSAIVVFREVMAELALDMQEVATFLFELVGVDDVCGRIGRLGGRLATFAFYVKPSWVGSLGHRYGSRRSVVRMIGTQLAFKPAKRLHFNVLSYPNVCTESRDCPHVPSLADAFMGQFNCAKGAPERIGELEDELEQLKSKVVSIITADHSARLPPPPPPPLPPQPVYATAVKRIETKAILNDRSESKSTNASKGSMMEVLKDIGKVTLRKVDRSPGGTPLRLTPPLPATNVNDPAAILAAALKKRFSHLQTLHESFEEDDFDDNSSNWDASPYSSPLVRCWQRPFSYSPMKVCLNPVPAL